MTLHKLLTGTETATAAPTSVQHLAEPRTLRHRRRHRARARDPGAATSPRSAARSTASLRWSVRRKASTCSTISRSTLGSPRSASARAAVLLDRRPGVFISARRYTTRAATARARSSCGPRARARADEVRARLQHIVGDQRLRDQMFVVDWHFCDSRRRPQQRELRGTRRRRAAGRGIPVARLPRRGVRRRLPGCAGSVLILLGPPGTGKTRLVRAILAAITRRKGENAEVMYTADKRALGQRRDVRGVHHRFARRIRDRGHRSPAQGAHQRQRRDAPLPRRLPTAWRVRRVARSSSRPTCRTSTTSIER